MTWDDVLEPIPLNPPDPVEYDFAVLVHVGSPRLEGGAVEVAVDEGTDYVAKVGWEWGEGGGGEWEVTEEG